MLCIDSLAEWSKALAPGASPQGRGFEPHSCHFVCSLLYNFDLRLKRVGNQRILSGTQLLADRQRTHVYAPLQNRLDAGGRSAREF